VAILLKYNKQARVAVLPMHIVKYFAHKNAKICLVGISPMAKQNIFVFNAQKFFTSFRRKNLNFVVEHVKTVRKKQKRQGYVSPVLFDLRQSLLG